MLLQAKPIANKGCILHQMLLLLQEVTKAYETGSTFYVCRYLKLIGHMKAAVFLITYTFPVGNKYCYIGENKYWSSAEQCLNLAPGRKTTVNVSRFLL